MSLDLIKACKAIQVSPTQKSVLMAVAWYASDDGEYWGSVFTICEHTCLSERAVRKTLHDLTNAGYLTAQIRSGTSTKYTVTPAPRAPLTNQDNTCNPCTPCTPAPDAPLHDMQDSPAPDAPPPLHAVHPTPARRAPNKQLATNTATNKQQESARTRGTRLPTDWALPVEWAEWAIAERPGYPVVHEAAKFRDHWLAQSGQKGVKADWAATWRNWVRNSRLPVSQKQHDRHSGFGKRDYHEGANDF